MTTQNGGNTGGAGATGAVFSLTYASSAVRLFSDGDLEVLLRQSRDYNAKASITGMLLYKDGNFMQVLEGPERAVRDLYEKIRADPRHRGEVLLHEGDLRERRFPGWSMAYRDLNAPAARDTPGYSDFLNTPLTGKEFSENPAQAQKLLLAFKKSM